MMKEDIARLRERLSLYKQAEKDILDGGAVKNIKKDDFFTSFTSLEDLRIAITELESKITILEVNI